MSSKSLYAIINMTHKCINHECNYLLAKWSLGTLGKCCNEALCATEYIYIYCLFVTKKLCVQQNIYIYTACLWRKSPKSWNEGTWLQQHFCSIRSRDQPIYRPGRYIGPYLDFTDTPVSASVGVDKTLLYSSRIQTTCARKHNEAS